ncbi:zinc finger C2HC domain-containing protein 1C-like [Mugil cephalus]|uniref:zinc finger C2HC domain-containing protein 1C-like n=1 Tax=Mugil cephalus TaxID=48193 RepID=UPI001FB7505D|nr:zinc finger C2HC domain-containing protein 1C-like [Mugil cephalus]
MNTNTSRRNIAQAQNIIAGQRHGNGHTHAQRDVLANRKAATLDQPFPTKPVSHRRTLRAQVSFDSDKFTVSTHPRGQLPSHSNGAGSRHSRKDTQPSGELSMARAIHAKELMLQEKLWKAEAKIRQKIQWDAADVAADDDRKDREVRHNRGQAERGKAQMKSRVSEQQKQRSRDTSMEGRQQEDFKQPGKKLDQKAENRVRNEVYQVRVTKAPLSKGKTTKATLAIPHKEQEVSGEMKSTRKNMKEHARRKEGDEKDYGICGETKHNKQNKTHVGDTVQTENQRSSQVKLPEESALPPISSPSQSSRSQPEERTLVDNADVNILLLPCKFCNRTFASERLEKHVQVCKKMTQSHRPVFNSYTNRTKGSVLEEFYKTHPRSETPEKKNRRQSYKGNISNLPPRRLPAGTSQQKWSK